MIILESKMKEKLIGLVVLIIIIVGVVIVFVVGVCCVDKLNYYLNKDLLFIFLNVVVVFCGFMDFKEVCV